MDPTTAVRPTEPAPASPAASETPATGQKAPKTVKSCHLVLVRHASRDRKPREPEEDHRMANLAAAETARGDDKQPLPGLPMTVQLAGALADALSDRGVTTETAILHSKHVVAEETADVIAWVLSKRFDAEPKLVPLPELTPGSPSNATAKNRIDHYLLAGGLVVVVGHQPQLTRIARQYKATIPGGVLPLGNSEAAYLHGTIKERRSRSIVSGMVVKWLITEKPSTLLEELRKKVASKLDIAKFLLGALVVNAGLVLRKELWAAEPGLDGSIIGRQLSTAGLLLVMVSMV